MKIAVRLDSRPAILSDRYRRAKLPGWIMAKTTWEMDGFDWDLEGYEGRKISGPEVLSLLLAVKEEDAMWPYWRMEHNIFKNNTAFPSAVPVFKMILSMLPMTQGAGRRYSLETLELILFCEGQQSSPGVVEECQRELRMAAWFLFHGIQFDDPELVWLYCDLIRLLGMAFDDLQPKCEFYLRGVLNREIPADAELSVRRVDGIRARLEADNLWPRDLH